MKKEYVAPEVVDFGDVAQITGVFGASGADDVFIDHTGVDISNENDPGAPGGSIDACATRDQTLCMP